MTYDPAEVEIAALRVVRANQAAELAQLRHVLKHTAAGIAAARNSLSRSRERLCAMVGSATHREQVDMFLGIVEAHLASTERVCVEQQCACAETEAGNAFVEATERPRGKVISLGSRIRPPRVYEQAPGQPLHAVCERRTDEEFASAHELPEGPGAA